MASLVHERASLSPSFSSSYEDQNYSQPVRSTALQLYLIEEPDLDLDSKIYSSTRIARSERYPMSIFGPVPQRVHLIPVAIDSLKLPE